MSRDTEVIRPGTIVITLVLMSISTLFLGLSAAYLYTLFSRNIEAPLPPIVFFVNIPVLYCATYKLRQCLDHFDNQAHNEMIRSLKWSLTLTLVFIVLQVIGWIMFFRDIPLAASQARSFLFVLSAIHLLHVFAGLPFLIRFLWVHRNPIDVLISPADDRRIYLRGLVRYWRFLDVLWILLVVMLCAGYALHWV